MGVKLWVDCLSRGPMVFYKQYLEHGVTPVCIKIQGDMVAKAFLHGHPFISELYSPICDFLRKTQFQRWCYNGAVQVFYITFEKEHQEHFPQLFRESKGFLQHLRSSICCETEQEESEQASCPTDLETAPPSAPVPDYVLGTLNPLLSDFQAYYYF